MTVNDSSDQLLKEMDRGQQARDLLEHPLMQEAFSTIRESYLTQWKNSPARDADGREKIWAYLKQLDLIEAHLTTTLETGKMAQHQIGLMERMKRGVRSLVA